ncbi:EamA family transporter [Aquirufa sp. ROCK2-A2]
MVYLLLSILFSVLLLVNFRLHEKWKVNTTVAILLNYPVCFLTGWFHQLDAIPFNWPGLGSSLGILALGIGFVITFLFSGISTQKNGMAVTSLANNLSLVIPVLFGLFFMGQLATITWQISLGLLLAFGAIYMFNPRIQASSAKGSYLALIAVFIGYGITNTAFSYLNASLSQIVGGTIPFTLMLLVGSIVTSFVVLNVKFAKDEIVFNKQSVLAAIPLGLPNFFSFYFLLKALDFYQNDLAIVLPVYNIGVIATTALVAWLFFKEKLNSKQLIGLLFGIMAIVLLLNK